MKSTYNPADRYQVSEILQEIHDDIQYTEEAVGFSICFLNQKPLNKYDTCPVHRIPASTLKSKYPKSTMVCWAANDRPHWRITSEEWNYIELEQAGFLDSKGNRDVRLYSSGYSYPRTTNALLKIDQAMRATANVFKVIYGMEITL